MKIGEVGKCSLVITLGCSGPRAILLGPIVTPFLSWELCVLGLLLMAQNFILTIISFCRIQ